VIETEAETLPSAPSSRARYGVVVLLGAVLLFLDRALVPVAGAAAALLLGYLVVLVAAWYGGLGPGLLAVATGALVALSHFDQPGIRTAVRMFLFVVTGLATVLLFATLERARRRAQDLAAARRRVERMLKQSQQLAHVGTWVLDLDDLQDLNGNALSWTDETYRIFGYEPGAVEVTNELFFSRVHPADRPRITEAVGEALRDGRPYQIEHRVIRPDGREIWVHEWAAIVFDRQGRPRRMLGTAQDITERRHAEQALREREDLLRILMNAVPALISYVDRDCRYALVNQTYQRWLGLEPQHIKGRAVSEVLGPAAWERVRPRMRRALAGQVVEYEDHLVYRDGGVRWVRASYTPDRDPDGTVRGVVVLVHDLSERKAAEEALREAAERTERLRLAAESSNRAKDRFLAVLSHELRTPLTPVLGAAAMLEGDRDVPPSVRATAAMIRKNAELEARLIDDLLDLTRISRGKLSLHFESVDAHGKIDDVLRACAGDLESKRLRVELDLQAASHHVHADQARFQQVIWNVVKNAVKFSNADGRVIVRTRNPTPETFALAIEDTGIGIEPALMPRLFDAFEQGSPEVTRRFGGLGLGLAVSKALIESQGGTIEAASAGQGLGATFTITLPVAAEARQAPIEEQRLRSDAPSGANILVVEDHPDTALLLTEVLGRRGYRVRTAETVADALRAFEAEAFDLLLSDLGLPDGSGNDLMRHLRLRRRIAGVALSGFGLERDIQEAKAAGFAEHLTKPINPERLLEVVARVIAGASTRRSRES
jgi:two-component system CheB/CheR fusion protein